MIFVLVTGVLSFYSCNFGSESDIPERKYDASSETNSVGQDTLQKVKIETNPKACK